MKNLFRIILLPVILCSACTIARKDGIRSNIPLQNKVIVEDLGAVSSFDFGIIFLFWNFSSPNIQNTINGALKKKNADALVDISFKERFIFTPIISVTTLNVNAMAVKISDVKPAKIGVKK